MLQVGFRYDCGRAQRSLVGDEVYALVSELMKATGLKMTVEATIWFSAGLREIERLIPLHCPSFARNVTKSKRLYIFYAEA